MLKAMKKLGSLAKVLIPGGSRTLARAQRTFERARPGSVLVLVVALLVLVALIGAAYISTSRNDRYATVANAVNAHD